MNGGTQYPARFFYAEYETFNFVLHFISLDPPFCQVSTSSVRRAS